MERLLRMCRGAADEESFRFARFQNEAAPSDFKEQQTTTSPVKEIDTDVETINEWQAGWNVTNAIQGMFIVTFPYAVLEGGYWAILAMVVVAYVCCYTGNALIDCLYEYSAETNKKERVRDSYVAVAEQVWGHGGVIVFIAQVTELLMTCILYVLLCGDLLVGSFPFITALSLTDWTIVVSVFLIPCAFINSLRHVSTLSFWCMVSHLFINAIIIIYCLTRVSTWKWSQVLVRIDIWTFPISLGIIIFSYTSQIFLPTLEGSLEDKSTFPAMMYWTHGAAAVFKAGFSYIGFLTFGFATKEVITNNLPNVSMRAIVNLILVLKALLSYPLPYFAAVRLLEKRLPFGRAADAMGVSSAGRYVTCIALRVSLVAFTVLVAVSLPHFALLMGLIGSITGNMLSLVWPAYFHLSIKRNELTTKQKAVDYAIISMGLVCSGLGFYYSTYALVAAFKGHETRPFQTARSAESSNFTRNGL